MEDLVVIHYRDESDDNRYVKPLPSELIKSYYQHVVYALYPANPNPVVQSSSTIDSFSMTSMSNPGQLFQTMTLQDHHPHSQSNSIKSTLISNNNYQHQYEQQYQHQYQPPLQYFSADPAVGITEQYRLPSSSSAAAAAAVSLPQPQQRSSALPSPFPYSLPSNYGDDSIVNNHHQHVFMEVISADDKVGDDDMEYDFDGLDEVS